MSLQIHAIHGEASRCADSRSRTWDVERQKVRPCTLFVEIHRHRVAGTSLLSLMQPWAWPSLIFRTRYRRRMYACTASLTSLLPRVEERHNKIHRKTVGPLSYSDYSDNFSVVVADRPSFINPHDEAATRRIILSLSLYHLFPSLLLILFLSCLVPVRDRGISFEVRDYL